MENVIRALRKEKGVSQEELAKRCGVSRQTVNAIENNKYDPTLSLAFQLARELGHVRVRGLMAIPPVPAHPEDNRPYFLKMQQLFVDIRAKMSDNQSDIDCLSMGMSADFEDAIAQGATLVRVGTALFGPRPYPAGAAR